MTPSRLVEPLTENNAIAVTAFVIELVELLSPEQLKTIIEKASELSFSQKLPVTEKIEKTTLEIIHTPNSLNKFTQLPKIELGGARFSDGPDPMSWLFEVRDNLLIAKCFKYTGWTETLSIALSLISGMKDFIPTCSIKNIVLEYVDIFYVNGEQQKWTSELFCDKNNYLPRTIFEVNDLWHSNNGYFSNEKISDEIGCTKVLTNYMVSHVTNEESKKIIEIKASHRTATEPGAGIGMLKELIVNNAIESFFTRFHQMNLTLISNMLTRNAKLSISLKD